MSHKTTDQREKNRTHPGGSPEDKSAESLQSKSRHNAHSVPHGPGSEFWKPLRLPVDFGIIALKYPGAEGELFAMSHWSTDIQDEIVALTFLGNFAKVCGEKKKFEQLLTELKQPPRQASLTPWRSKWML